MRKNLFIAIILVLVLALMGGTASAAGNVTLFESSTDDTGGSTYVESMCKYGDGLCLRMGDGVYTWTPADAKPVLLFDTSKFDESAAGFNLWSMSYMMELDGKIIVYNRDDGKLYEISAEGFKATELKLDPMTLPGAKGEPMEDANLINNVFAIDGSVYAIARPSEQNWNECSLYEANLQTGELKLLTPKTDRIIGASSYADGKLLITIGYSYEGRTPEEQVNSVRVFNKQTGEYEGDAYKMDQNWYNVSGAIYDQATGYIYMMQGARILRFKLGEKFEVVNYMQSQNYYSEMMPIIVGDKITFMSYRNIILYSLNPDDIPKTILKVDGSVWIDEAALPKFQAAHPDVAVYVSDSGYYSMENLQTALSGSDAPDVFTFSTYGNIDQMFSKGYAKDISSDARLMEKVKRMWPQLQEVVLKDGKLYGFPISMYAQMWSYSEKMLEEVGLEFPETFKDFIDMIADWDEDYDAGSTEQRALTDSYYMEKNSLFSMILNQYIIANEKPDQPVKFDTPEFREVMTALERSPIKQMSAEEQSGVRSSDYGYEYVEPIINTYGGLWVTNQVPVKRLCLPPKLSQSSEPIVSADLTLFVVNPNTDKLDIALEYINFVEENLDVTERFVLYSDLTEPVESKYWERNKAEAEKYYQELLKEEVTPENQREHDERVADQKKYIEEDMERWRYDVSAAAIEQYREIAPYIKVMTSNLLYNSDTSEEFYKIIQRYQQKQLNLDQMIRELDQKAQMIFLETR